MKFLIVDDDKSIRALVRSWLESDNHQVEEAEDGKAAIAKFLSTAYDAVILDVEMPKINGFKVAKRLRSLAERWIPIIFVSGHDNDEFFLKCIDAGGDFYFSKPLREVRFLAFIKGLERMHNVRVELEYSDEHLLKIQRNTKDGIILINSSSQIITINDAGLEIFNYKKEDIEGQSIEKLTEPDHEGNYENFVSTLQNNNDSGDIFREVSGIRKNGDVFPLKISLSIIEKDGEVLASAVIQDSSERLKHQEEINFLANFDPLTQLPNRNYFIDRLKNSVAYGHRNNSKTALLFLNIDGFKEINNTYGNEIGDKLLIEISDRLRNLLRSTDTVARLSSDEFAIILDDVHRKELIYNVIKKLDIVFKEVFYFNRIKIRVTASTGISISSGVSAKDDVNTMISQADMALYRSKQISRGSYQFFDLSINAENLYHMELKNELKEAFIRREFVAFYQPQINIATGQLSGSEVLLRWKRKSTGKLVSPMDFIPVLEELDLIVEVTNWLLEDSIKQWKKWIASGLVPEDSTVAVNLSVKSFKNDKLVSVVKKTCENLQFNYENLVLEVTETMMAEDIDKIKNILLSLKDLGVKIALDDFGTGYSSLSYLSDLPIDELKIDKAFLDKLSSSEKDRALLISIIDMAHNMGMFLVGEGVDSDEKLEFLRKNNCEISQGFLFSPPLAPEDFVKKISAM